MLSVASDMRALVVYTNQTLGPQLDVRCDQQVSNPALCVHNLHEDFSLPNVPGISVKEGRPLYFWWTSTGSVAIASQFVKTLP